MNLALIVSILIASNIATGAIVYIKTSKRYKDKIKDIRVAFNSSMVSNRKLESILENFKQ